MICSFFQAFRPSGLAYFLGLFSVASACSPEGTLLAASASNAAEVPCDIAAAIDEIRDHGNQDAYLCVATSDAGDAPLREAISANQGNANRLTRALGIWLLLHAEQPFAVENVALIGPSDERLLADGIKARRGRRSAVADHESVFLQFDWYKPVPHYTDAMLRPIDRENLAALAAPIASPTVGSALTPAVAVSRPLSSWIVPGVLLGATALAGVYVVSRARKT